MTNPHTSQEKIEYLATKMMGWEKRKGQNSFWFVSSINNDIQAMTGYSWDEERQPYNVFNPLEDWNHWRQVEEKVMEDDVLYAKWILDITFAQESYKGFWEYMEADLPTRVDALIAAHQLLNP